MTETISEAKHLALYPFRSIPKKSVRRENRLDRSGPTNRRVLRPDYIVGGAEGYTAAIIRVFRGFIMADSV